MDIKIKTETVNIFLGDQLCLIGLIDGSLQMLALADEFAAHIDVTDMRTHCAASNQTAFNQEMRIVPHDFAVLTGARLGFIRIDDEVARASIRTVFWHE